MAVAGTLDSLPLLIMSVMSLSVPYFRCLYISQVFNNFRDVFQGLLEPTKPNATPPTFLICSAALRGVLGVLQHPGPQFLGPTIGGSGKLVIGL